MSTSEPGAIVSTSSDSQYNFYGTFANFVGTYPTATVGSGTPFVIFDWAPGNPDGTNSAGFVTVSQIVLGNAK